MASGELLFYSDFSGSGIAGDQITGEPWDSESHRINDVGLVMRIALRVV